MSALEAIGGQATNGNEPTSFSRSLVGESSFRAIGELEAPVSELLMVKRPRTMPAASGEPAKLVRHRPRRTIVRSSLYLPEAVHEALREAAFKERRKIHDIVMEGIEMVLRKYSGL